MFIGQQKSDHIKRILPDKLSSADEKLRRKASSNRRPSGGIYSYAKGGSDTEGNLPTHHRKQSVILHGHEHQDKLQQISETCEGEKLLASSRTVKSPVSQTSGAAKFRKHLRKCSSWPPPACQSETNSFKISSKRYDTQQEKVFII